MSLSDEIVLALPGPVESIAGATEFRSTWLASSLEGLRLQGHLERYLTLLSGHREAILGSVAAAWVPLEVARAHYEACDRLGLGADAVEAMAREAGSIRRQWHATIIASAQRADANIWDILAQLHKYWLRSANGGAVAVYRLSDKRARVEYVGCELFDIEYFRQALRVVLLLLCEHLCDGVKVLRPIQLSPTAVAFPVQWRETRALDAAV